MFVEAEDTIPEGLQPGTGEENIVDEVGRGLRQVPGGGRQLPRRPERRRFGLAAPTPPVYVVDLLNLPVGGFVLTEFDDVDAVRWDRVGYDIPNASASVEGRPRAPPRKICSSSIDNGFSIYVEGAITKADGQSCLPGSDDCAPATEVKFAWGLAAGTSFDDCAPEEGDAGFAVPSGGTAQIKPTIHGDHWFFTNITQGAEITERRAQWIADSDLDRDGEDDARRAAHGEGRRGVHAGARLLGDGRVDPGDHRVRLPRGPGAHARRLPGRGRVSDACGAVKSIAQERRSRTRPRWSNEEPLASAGAWAREAAAGPSSHPRRRC